MPAPAMILSRPSSLRSADYQTSPVPSYQSDTTVLAPSMFSLDPEKQEGRELDTISTTYETFSVDRPAPAAIPPPEVGIKPWLAVLGGFCAQFCSFGMMSMIGIFIAYYRVHQLEHLSTSAISWIGSIQSGVFAFSGLFCGRIVDMYGPHYVTIPGLFFIVIGMIGTAFSTHYYQFIVAQGLSCAIGAAGLFYGTTSAITSWFTTRRGLAFGIAASGAGVGGIGIPFLLQYMFYDYGSFKAGACTLAGVFCFMGLVTVCVTTSRVRPTGRQPYRFVRFYVRPFRDPIFALFTLAMALIYLGIFVPNAYFSTTALHYGMTTAHASYLLSFFNAGSLVGRIVGGYLFDRFSKFLVYFCYVLMGGLTLLPGWYLATDETRTIVVSVCYGFASGGMLALFSAVIAQISPVTEIGTRVGACNGALSISALVSLPISGAIVGMDANYHGMQAFAGSTILAGSAVCLVLKFMVDGKRIRAS
ncbi:major facilitator superfamily domain-containing protein [Myxozyma melibiosi]|uniref:Major facilitator superfamily domain-containing protein n=1 Tax=Myxozyma melibiosi TaxID=54550 RepID=A0ABR1F550_9ASCO